MIIKFKKTKVLSATIVFVALFFAWSAGSQAAELRLVPPSGPLEVGANFSVTVQLVSSGQTTNAVSGVIKFPTDRLQVTSISQSGSMVNLWVQEPTFSNMSGQVSFEGAILNPGFTGAVGRLLTVNFQAKTEGTANLAFSSGSILANDGQGTEILKKLGSAVITVVVKKPVPALPATETTAPQAVVEQDQPSLAPPVLEVNEIKLPPGDKARFIFSAKAGDSALDYYEVRVDDALALLVPAEGGSHIYNTPALSAGRHTFTVSIFDRAGNRAQERLDFKISRALNNSLLIDWGGSLVTVLSVAVPLIGLIMILLIVSLAGWRRLLLLKIRLRREVSEAEIKLTEFLEKIREDLREQMSALEKAKQLRALTAVEKQLLRVIKSDLSEATQTLKKEINDIEKQIK